MDYTTNKNLAKPTENETYDLTTVNENMDKIDAALKTNDDAITQLTENIGKLHFSQINSTTDQFGQISTIIPNSKIISAWCNKPRSFVTSLSEQGTGLCVYETTNKSLTDDNVKPLANTNVDVNVLYYDF